MERLGLPSRGLSVQSLLVVSRVSESCILLSEVLSVEFLLVVSLSCGCLSDFYCPRLFLGFSYFLVLTVARPVTVQKGNPRGTQEKQRRAVPKPRWPGTAT